MRDPESPGHGAARPARVGDLLPDAARGLGLEDELRLARAIATWDALVAERVPPAVGRVPARRARAATRSSCAADEPIVAAELRMRATGAARGVRRGAGWRARALRCGSSRTTPGGPDSPEPEPPRIIPIPAADGIRHALPLRARRSLHEARCLAVRLQLKLGAVTEQDRLADSPDTDRGGRAVGRLRRTDEGQPVPARDLEDARQPRARGDPRWSRTRSATSTTTTSRPGSGSA